MTKVAIFGGGVGGLTAAHELLDLGFEVEVYERAELWGGKARSFGIEGTGKDGRKDLPGEHGFRFFPGFYKHIPDTLRKIPFPGNKYGCYGNLTKTTQIALYRENGEPVVMPANFPKNFFQWKEALHAVFGSHLGIPKAKRDFFVRQILKLATSCEERMEGEYEFIPWWKYLRCGPKDPNSAYQKMLAEGLTRSLVAMKAEMASTRTVGRMLLQMIYNMMTPGVAIDRVLNGPTSEVWIDPWVELLSGYDRATLTNHASVMSFNMDDGRIGSVTVDVDGSEREVIADHYISALPVEKMRALAGPEMRRAAPSLARTDQLLVKWMNGIQFYLNHDVPVVEGHTIFVDSKWALTSISQHQFWHGIDLSEYGDGTVRGILSIDVSDWETDGNKVVFQPAEHCSPEEIIKEVWAELKAHLNEGGQQQLEDADLVAWNIDPDIVFPRSSPKNDRNIEPLLINTAGSLENRPEAGTEIENLCLASDYVHTFTDLACMEGANEAARRAVNAILDREHSKAKRCKVWPFKAPAPFRWLQKYDKHRWKHGHHQHSDFDNLPDDFTEK